MWFKRILSNSSITIDIISIIVVFRIFVVLLLSLWVLSGFFYLYIDWALSIEHGCLYLYLYFEFCMVKERENTLFDDDDDVILYRKMTSILFINRLQFQLLCSKQCDFNLMNEIEWTEIFHWQSSVDGSVLGVSRLNDQHSQRPRIFNSS